MEIMTGGCCNDGTRDVAQLVVWNGPTLSVENVETWYWTGSTEINSVAVGDVDADVSMEIATGGNYFDGTRRLAQLCVWKGATLAVEDIKAWYWIGDTTINSATVGNVDGDGDMEILTGGYHWDGTRDLAQLCIWT